MQNSRRYNADLLRSPSAGAAVEAGTSLVHRPVIGEQGFGYDDAVVLVLEPKTGSAGSPSDHIANFAMRR